MSENRRPLEGDLKIKWDGDVAVREHRYASQAEQSCIDF
nr:MAG TPA: hypothetical protein [Caudoviricetes sp.]